MYRNADWDIVDAKKEGKAIPKADLPAELQNLDDKARDELVAKKAKEREELQKQIAKLSSEREQYVQAEMKKKAKDATKTMDDALIESAKVQAEKADFAF
jgi:hypothetical protein